MTNVITEFYGVERSRISAISPVMFWRQFGYYLTESERFSKSI